MSYPLSILNYVLAMNRHVEEAATVELKAVATEVDASAAKPPPAESCPVCLQSGLHLITYRGGRLCGDCLEALL